MNYDVLYSILPDPYDKTLEAGVNACKHHGGYIKIPIKISLFY